MVVGEGVALAEPVETVVTVGMEPIALVPMAAREMAEMVERAGMAGMAVMEELEVMAAMEVTGAISLFITLAALTGGVRLLKIMVALVAAEGLEG